MGSKLFPSLAATAFAAILFNFFLRRRSREIKGKQAINDAATNDGTARGASSTHNSTESRGSEASSGYEYEVFLSFSRSDTGVAGFTDFLYTILIDMRIRTYKSNEDLHNREEFSPEILQAINQSKILIPIFSKGYAASVWCLRELVQIVEGHKLRGQNIIPIFFDVAPFEVQYQTRSYREAFRSHKKKGYNEENMREWKAALSVVGTLNKWDLHSMPTRREGQFANTLAKSVFSELKKAYLMVSHDLVGVDHHVDEIMDVIDAQTSETQIIGIHGMGGVGKTTIAKMIYNQLSNNFENCCFLSNIREMSKEKGIVSLQSVLISDLLKKGSYVRNIDEGIRIIQDRLPNKRVLLLLDDVDGKEHMDALVGKRDWFGKGSKIIITTRKKDVLNALEVDCSYELNSMDPDQSLQLFSKYAFKRDYPLSGYINQSKKAIDIAGGLPLTLKVMGSLLFYTRKEWWDDMFERLEDPPLHEVQSKLEISYDALDLQQKHIFLDIACLLVGYDRDIIVHFWDESNFFPEEAMEVLQNTSLIKIKEDNKVWMHIQLRDLGREIVRRDSNMEIENQSRVWNPEEALLLLQEYEGKENTETLGLKFDCQQQYCFTYEDFMRLSNLRFLEFDGSMENFRAEERLLWHESPSNVHPTNIFQENSDLLPQLRWLSWHNIPPLFNITNFSMKNIVILDLSQSEITHDWNGWSHMKVIKNLKVLNLTSCCRLERTPNFSVHTNLERLILRACGNLIEIDRSICQLRRLVSLDVRYCRHLRRLPGKLGGLSNLKELLIDCTLIEEIPNCQGMRNLRIFTASRCRITTLPLSARELATLEYLSLGDCWSLKRLPDSVGNLESLIELDISGTMIEELPDSIRNLKNLKVLKMSGSSISKIPDALWTMDKLEEIEAADNRHLHVEIGNGICRSPSLRFLKLRHAKIYAVPRLPESLISLYLSEVCMKMFPDLSNLINLKELHLCFGARACDVKSYELVEDPNPMPWWIGKLSKLKSLNLSSAFVTTLPTDICLLPRLLALDLTCSNLRCLPTLPSSLLSLSLNDCASVSSMDLSNLRKLSSLVVCSSAISEIRGLDCLENLQNLWISGLGQVGILPDLSNLNQLRFLALDRCGSLVEIQGELPHSLEVLEIFSCESLKTLPDPSSLKGLQKAAIKDCMKLDLEAILRFARRSQANL